MSKRYRVKTMTKEPWTYAPGPGPAWFRQGREDWAQITILHDYTVEDGKKRWWIQLPMRNGDITESWCWEWEAFTEPVDETTWQFSLETAGETDDD